MLIALMVSLVMTLLAPQTPVQVPPTAPTTKSTTPAGCLQEVHDYADAANQAAGITGAPITDRNVAIEAQRINRTKIALAKQCAAQFDPKAAAEKDLASLAQLYADAGMTLQAQTVVERALPLKTMAPADRAALLVTAVTTIRTSAPSTEDRPWRVANLYPRIEAAVDELDALPAATFDQKSSVHRTMLSVYRGDDIDGGIAKHATWFFAAEKAMKPAERQKLLPVLLASYIDLAEAWAGQGKTAQAIELLGKGQADLAGDIPAAKASIEPELARLQLVGTAAAPITAPRWLNAPAGQTSLPMTGSVTLLEFTAHWCGPCRESYPGLNRLLDRFKGEAFREVMVTRLWGFFLSERDLGAEAEVARDTAYFKEHHLDVPVAIGNQVVSRMADGKVQYDPGPDPNDTAYRVGGIPQIHLIDKHGVIRLVMVGYDRTNEDALSSLIASLLREK